MALCVQIATLSTASLLAVRGDREPRDGKRLLPHEAVSDRVGGPRRREVDVVVQAPVSPGYRFCGAQ